MRAVCKTFESDIDASTSLLHTAIEPEHLRSYGYEELQPIVQSVTSLIESAPEFVADLYKAAFTWREPAEEETAMNPSRILGFKSNKRQDYQHSCWELDQRFHNFLEGHLKLATEVIEVVIAYHAVEEHRADKNTEPFEVDGISTGFRNDYSSIWENTYGNFGSEPVSMLHQYFRYLDQEVVSQSSSGIPRDIFEILVGRGRVAILWRRLIELALKHPSVASQLRSAAWARPLLLGYGMQRPMHLFLQSVYPTLTDQEKVLVEDAIMNLPRRMKGMIFDRETRDEYLGALEGQQLRTPRARRQQTLLRNAEALRREAPEEYRVNGGAFSPPPEVLYGLRGIDPNRPSNRELIALQVPARDFNTKYMSQVPTIEDATEILGDLEILWCSLSDAGPLLPDESLVHESFAILIHAASKIAIIKDLTNSQSLYRFTERVLLTGAAALWPEVDEEKNAQFDASGGWGSPSGRVEASEGLMALATVQKSETILVHPALHKLLNDPSAVVRTQIASAALGLYYTFPERMWSMIDHFATDESVQVRKAIVSALDQLARAHPKRALTPMASILGSMDPAQEGTSDLARLAIQYLTMYYIWRGDETAEEVIVDLASKLPGSIAAAGYMTFPLRHGMMAAPGADRTAEEARLVRERSVRIFGLLITNTSSLLKPLITARLNGQDLTNHEVKCFSDLIDLARILSRELYFAVGAFQENRYDLAPEIKTPEQPWLYYAIGTGWDLLGEVGEAQTAHSLTQSLEMFIRLDPETIFLRIGSILRASKAWGYQYEQMGFDLVLRIFTTYLAEYPDLFQGSSKCLQIMRETLELFISVGWANARRLSYRLDELFR
jgi:hypothetical protein